MEKVLKREKKLFKYSVKELIEYLHYIFLLNCTS